MYAVIKTGGKQYRVSEGDELFIEKLEVEAGETIAFDEIIAIADGEGSIKTGKDIASAVVEAEVIKNGRAKKIIVFKYKPKKGYRLKKGHRQPYTNVRIKSIKA